MSSDLSFVQLFLQASLVVKLVILTLIAASFISWSYIISKKISLMQVKASSDNFDKKFWAGGDMQLLYNDLTKKNTLNSGTASLFCAGFREFIQLQHQKILEPKILESGVWRAMDIALSKETQRLEKNLAFLATVQSISPYIGLFGTVWGIMHSFSMLGNVQHATLSMVAPGISEALVATAIGLVAAIPAGIAYNRYSQHVYDITERGKIFMQEFINLLNRQVNAR